MAAEGRRGNRVRRALGLTALLVCAVLVGVVSAVWGVRNQFSAGGLQNGPWATNANIGSSGAGAYLRAGVALGGLLALNLSETVYFTAIADEGGAPLDASCVYRIEGKDPAARWWSITAYGDDHFLIPGSGGRFSVDKTAVERGESGDFVIVVGGEPRPRNWIASGEAGARAPFSLTLRMYNPDPAVVADLAGATLPRIVLERCA